MSGILIVVGILVLVVCAVIALLWTQALAMGLPEPAAVPHGHVLLVPDDALYHRAVEVVTRIDREETTASWQNKWHQASGKLYAEFPERTKREITRAIEAALGT